MSFPDNYQFTAGSGTKAATDQLATGEHVVLMKLLDGTADSSAVIPGDATNGLYVNVKALAALPAGTNAIGKLAANDGVDVGDVTINNAIGSGVYIRPGSGINLDTSAVTVTSTVPPAASATVTGLTTDRKTNLTNTAYAVKASSGRLYGYHIFNANTSDVYVQLYDVASGSVTVGSTTPKLTYWVPAGGALDTVFEIPISFATAITTACTTSVTGGVAPTSSILANILYA